MVISTTFWGEHIQRRRPRSEPDENPEKPLQSPGNRRTPVTFAKRRIPWRSVSPRTNHANVFAEI
jgi:hypothetical protein